MNTQHPVWYGIGFTIIPLFALFLGYINIHPEFYRAIPGNFGASNDSTSTGIAWKDDEKDNPPLEYISDGYKALGLSTEIVEVTSFWSLWNIPQSKIEYEWRYKVKNLTDTKQNISVTYELHDKNGTIVSKSNASKLAEAGETIEIKEIGHIEYGDAQRITDASWSIGRHAIP